MNHRYVAILLLGLAAGFIAGRVSAPRPGGDQPPRLAAVPPATPADEPRPVPPPEPATGRPPDPPPPAPAHRDPRAIYDVPLVRTAAVPRPPQLGPDDARVTIVQVSDFQCSACSRAGPVLREVLARNGKDVRVVFANNPLELQEPARGAAEAALAAHEQGRFWEFHDRLYAEQASLGAETYRRIARELGLDLPRFEAALASGRLGEQLLQEQALYTSRGATATPAFFVNGRLLIGLQAVESLQIVIEEERSRADAELRKGTPRAGLYAALIRGGAATPVMLEALGAPPLAPDGPGPEPDRRYLVEVPGDGPSKGPSLAKVTIVEFADFQ